MSNDLNMAAGKAIAHSGLARLCGEMLMGAFRRDDCWSDARAVQVLIGMRIGAKKVLEIIDDARAQTNVLRIAAGWREI